VVAFLFDVTRAPYVVQTDDSRVQFEVPWRTATSVRTARRADLVQILTPVTRMPEWEVLSAAVFVDGTDRGTAMMTLYIVPHALPTVFPFHRCGGELLIGGSRVPLQHVHIPSGIGVVSQLVVEGPRRLTATGTFKMPESERAAEQCRMIMRLNAVGASSPVVAEAHLSRAPPSPGVPSQVLRWEFSLHNDPSEVQ
jgi:hypothetical protein